ncbi:MAG TPA: dephospho-CoA kinase [Woeseiaceae bacterium]|nr:dephospho-CoA kinase [Woeseiaceae bacterium]
MLKIGLTGGIASGKSTVSDMFAEYGVPVIDTDRIARDIVRPGMPALDKIRQRFGDEVIAADGSLDRGELRRLAFDNEQSRKALEAILHPKIRSETVARSKAAGGPYQIIVVPLLVESALKSFVDRIVVVDCDPQTQLQRLLSRDDETIEQAQRMIAAQAAREERLAIASDVIDNNGDISDTRKQVEELHRRFLDEAEAGREAK